MSPNTLTRRRRLLSGATAVALTTGVLALAPTTARAAQTGDLVNAGAEWSISGLGQRYYPGFANLHLPALDGVECENANTAPTTPQVVCSSLDWSGGTVTQSSADGTTTVALEGSTTLWATTGNQWVSLGDLEATFDATGSGEVSALVKFGTTTGGDWATATPKPAGTGTRVAIVDLDPEATGTGYPFSDTEFSVSNTADQRTWSGLKGLWAPEFLTYLHGPDAVPDAQGPGASTDGYVYHTAFQNQVDSASRVRYPSPFTFTADITKAETSAAVSESVPGSLKVDVSGTGFSKSGVGIYVSLGEQGSFSPTDASVFVKTNWVNAAAINADGSFASTLALDAADIAKLDPTKSYSVFTQKAHGQSVTDTTQTTETPVTIDFASLEEKSVAPAVTVKGLSTKYGRGGTVSVTSPTAGKVTVAGLGTRTVAARGTASFAVSKRQGVGTRSYRVTFAPADASVTAPAATTVSVKVARTAASKGKVKVTRKPTSKKKGLAVVSVKGASGAAAPTGKVKIKLTKGKKSKYVTANLSAGKRLVKLPKLAKGKWVVRVAYYGNANYTKRGYVKAGSFKVVK